MIAKTIQGIAKSHLFNLLKKKIEAKLLFILIGMG